MNFVAVIGAGAAGLAAARTLAAADVRVVVFEARNRIGGRLYTLHEAGLPVPIELGGEFVHGTAPETFALLRAANAVAIDVGGGSLTFEAGELRARDDDAFEAVGAALARAASLPQDVSLATYASSLDARTRRDALALVAGFDAADPARASVHALAAEWSDDRDGQTARQFRPHGGYDRVIGALSGGLDPARVHLRLATCVDAIRRDAHGVELQVHGSPPLRADAAIVTAPIGVLQSGALQFVPALPPSMRAALERIVMGPVVKLVLRFDDAFWETARGGIGRDAGFVQHRDGAFPTFWNLLPVRAPLLVAWAGGPRADALAALDDAARVRRALDDLRAIFGPETDPHGALVSAHQHDWQRDPFARGAYSYVAVGGMGAREALATPVDGTLFFAGEATAPASEAGTVTGALRSGERAARQVLGALAARRAS